MKENRFYKINKDSKVHFNNKVDFCVGTGRMELALQKEYQEHILYCHFSHNGQYSHKIDLSSHT